MKSRLIKLLIVGAVIAFVGSSVTVRAQTAAIELLSGASTIVVQDNGVGDTSSALGDIQWNGSINGWTIVVTTGDSKPILGSAASPQMDLSVTSATPGAGALTVEFTDTGFTGNGAIINTTNGGNNGTSVETASVLVDPTDTQFGGSPATSVGVSPYSLTIVDCFTVGTVSADDRVSVSVPDGGMTVLLLGAALTGLGLLKRRLA